MRELGLAIDIDDTLSETALTLSRMAGENYGFPDNMSIDKVMQKYTQPALVPDWQTETVLPWLQKTLNDPDFIVSLPVVAGAQEALAKISQKIPVAMYISSRLEQLMVPTRQWLQMHHFPQAPIILRKDSVRETNWKINHLLTENTKVYGIIDDTLDAFSNVDPNFKGKLFWLNRYGTQSNFDSNIIEVSNWTEIMRYM